MARPIVQALAANTTYTIPVDDQQSPTSLRWQVGLQTGATISYLVSYTCDDPNDSSFAPVWLADGVSGTALTASASNVYAAPIRALRVVTTTLTGSARLIILQGSSAR